MSGRKLKPKLYKYEVKVTSTKTGKVRKIPMWTGGRGRGGGSAATTKHETRPVSMNPDASVDDNNGRPLTYDLFSGLGGGSSKTGYLVRKEKELEKWESIRGEMLDAHVESQCMPFQQKCSKCGNVDAIARCMECSHTKFFCECCCKDAHSTINLLHFIELWKGGMFVPLTKPTPVFPLPATSDFDHKDTCIQSSRLITVVDYKGRQQDCILELCSCKSDCYFFMRNGFWAASPFFPRLAFTLDFMELLESMFIGSQVSLSSFCNSIKSNVPELLLMNDKGKDILSALQGESFEEYRYFRYCKATYRKLCPNKDNGTTCPACPSDGKGHLIECFDGCFGLVHKRKAGKYYFTPKHGNLILEDQEAVDNYIASYSKAKSVIKVVQSKCIVIRDLESVRISGRVSVQSMQTSLVFY